MAEFFSLLYLDGWQYFATLINTLLLFLLLKKLLFKPVTNMIQQRKDDIDTAYQNAETAEANAKNLQAEYEEKIANAKSEAAEIIKLASQKADKRSDEIVKEAGEKAADMMKKAEEQIEREKKKAINEIKDEISDMAVSIAAKVVEKDIKKADHEHLISDFIENAGDIKW
ncbi:MAG: F0F1 ATP synthase subunit B [Oscillospiraceae bacterium]|nr:F0F1 ATP synthase subunit B [Oscillospiraceae bacterium]